MYILLSLHHYNHVPHLPLCLCTHILIYTSIYLCAYIPIYTSTPLHLYTSMPVHVQNLRTDSALEAQQAATLLEDQNENQSAHEIEILKGIMSTCKEMSVISSQLVLGDVTSTASRRTPTKVGKNTMMYLTKYYMKHLENNTKHLAEELVDFHAQKVIDVEAYWQTCVALRSIESLSGHVHGQAVASAGCVSFSLIWSSMHDLMARPGCDRL